MSLCKTTIPVKGMQCTSCEGRIENMLRKLPGIHKAKASYVENAVYVEYDVHQCNLAKITQTITASGDYIPGTDTGFAGNIKNLTGILIVFLAILLLGEYTGNFDMSSRLKEEVAYPVLFVIGLFTSLHCIGMCGGILFSQTASSSNKNTFQAFLPACAYNAGRVLGYTMLGGIIGALGSAISVSIGFMSGVSIFAGVFMILMGLNMAGFNLFRRYLKIPWPRLSMTGKTNAPFLTGLLNSLMPCGPLQTMQLYALGTGSAVNGALAMLVFSLGTLPLMLSFGTMASFFNKNSSKRILKISGALVIVLGLIMTNRGLAIAGLNLPLSDLTAIGKSKTTMVAKAQLENGVQIVRMTANNRGYTPNVLYVQKDIPVKWIVEGEQINSCNNQIIIPDLNLKKKLSAGENIIEFTPREQDLNFSCWMGMIRGVVKVVDNVNAVDIANDKTTVASSSGCCSTAGTSGCCGRQAESIYGDDIDKVPTERIIKKATGDNSQQTVSVKGLGYEFEPLIVIIEKEHPAKISLDLTEFTDPQGSWTIVDYRTKAPAYSFRGRQGVIEINFVHNAPGTFGIYKDGQITGVIEVVDTLESADLEQVRAKFL